MNLSQITPGVALLGLAALAALLYALQRLRVRHEERVVVTTMFWREALEESRARTLVERFRHPLSYLLALLIAGLLWFSFARVDSRREAGGRHVVLLDASAGMGARDADGTLRYDLAKELLAEELRHTPRDRTEVLHVGAETRTLLAPGEDRALLDSRLEGLSVSAVPSSIEAALRAQLVARSDSATGDSIATRRFVVIGDAPLSDSLQALLEDGDVLEHVPVGEALPANRGITALGVAPAASGDWGRVDVLFELSGAGIESAPVGITLDGAPWIVDGTVSYETLAAEHVRGRLVEVPARGGKLRVALASTDALDLDDAAEITLPDRPPIRVAFVEGVDAGAESVLGDLLALDPAIEIVADAAAADVLVGDGPDGRPTLEISSAADSTEAIFVGHGAGLNSGRALQRAVGELGLDRIDGTALADALGAPITVGAAPTAARRVALWAELLDPERTRFVESRAFPLLLGRAVRWLGSAEPIVPYVAAGRAVPARAGEASRAVASLELSRVGVISPLSFGADVAPSSTVLDPVGLGGATPTVVAEASRPGLGPWRPYTWFLAIALVLLIVEWALYQRGRIA